MFREFYRGHSSLFSLIPLFSCISFIVRYNKVLYCIWDVLIRVPQLWGTGWFPVHACGFRVSLLRPAPASAAICRCIITSVNRLMVLETYIARSTERRQHRRFRVSTTGGLDRESEYWVKGFGQRLVFSVKLQNISRQHIVCASIQEAFSVAGRWDFASASFTRVENFTVLSCPVIGAGANCSIDTVCDMYIP